MSTKRIGAGWLAAVPLAGRASTDQPARMRVAEDATLVRGCQVLGTVSANDLGALPEKAARLDAHVDLPTPQRKSKGGYFGLQAT